MSLFRDVNVHLSTMTLLTVLMTLSGLLVWIALVLGAVAVCCRFLQGTVRGKRDGTWEPGYLQWFAVAKFVGALSGVVALNLVREIVVYNRFSHCVLTVLLALNICEAVVRDCQLGHPCNALTGLLLMGTLPWWPSAVTIGQTHDSMAGSGLVVYPLVTSWIALYTTWNAAFSYGDNYSIITRLMLFPPVLTAFFLVTPWAWLAARCFSLMGSMALRATQALYVYTPGQSPLTPVVGTIQHDDRLVSRWGKVNLLLGLLVAVAASDVVSQSVSG
jgi:hypothetical protein